MRSELIRRPLLSYHVQVQSNQFMAILLGPAVGRYPIKFILSEFVSYLGDKRVMCVGNA